MPNNRQNNNISYMWYLVLRIYLTEKNKKFDLSMVLNPGFSGKLNNF